MIKESITVALNKSSKVPVYIRNAKNGLECNCICEACEKDMVAVQGPENAWHFRHFEDSDCYGGPMTRLHQLAIQIIANNQRIHLPKGWFNYNSSRTKKFQSVYPDITIIATDGIRIHFEVKVTHADSEKEAFYRDGNHRCVEIDLSEIPRDISELDLTPIVIDSIQRKREINWEPLVQEAIIDQPAIVKLNWWQKSPAKEIIAFVGIFVLVRFLVRLLFPRFK